MQCYGTLRTMTALEVLIDEMCTALPLDPIEFRRRNALTAGDRAMAGNRYIVGRKFVVACRDPLTVLVFVEDRSTKLA